MFLAAENLFTLHGGGGAAKSRCTGAFHPRHAPPRLRQKTRRGRLCCPVALFTPGFPIGNAGGGGGGGPGKTSRRRIVYAACGHCLPLFLACLLLMLAGWLGRACAGPANPVTTWSVWVCSEQTEEEWCAWSGGLWSVVVFCGVLCKDSLPTYALVHCASCLLSSCSTYRLQGRVCLSR